MKKLLLFLIVLIFLAVSCSSSKKAENDADILPDEDGINDEDAVEPDEDEEADDEEENDDEIEVDEGNPCTKFANSDGEYIYISQEKFKCGCHEGYFWANPGCKKITFANICTGQKTCYNRDTNIKCPEEGSDFYGQDRNYAQKDFCFPKAFSSTTMSNEEGLTTDNNLKITWLRKQAGSTYSWYSADRYCEELEYEGLDDWRLPTPKELMLAGTLLHPGEYLWSSQAKQESLAWKLQVSLKYLSTTKKTEANDVRCVRGERTETPVLYEIQERGMVFDPVNGFSWDTSYTGMKPWQDALAYCENSTHAGFSDWRLPNIHELLSLVNYEKGNPASDFPYSALNFGYDVWWSSTTLVADSGYADYARTAVIFTGETSSLNKYEKARVICVRNEPCRKGYILKGERCVESPCKGNPCESIEHSDGVCNLSDSGGYSCGCVENYFWDGEKCVSPCDPNPCTVLEHTTGVCTPHDEVRYNCGCKEGFYWWGQNKGCHEKKPDLAHICTGQTKCYDNEKEIECPAKGDEFYGQDAQYADLGYCAPPNYTVERKVENEPVVIDNYTGLVWQQKVYLPETYIGWSRYKNYCETLNYGGYDDWRLPSILEYRTIMDFGGHHPNVDPEYFPGTPPEYFVTSTYTDYGCGELPHPTPATWVSLINFDHFETDTYTGCAADPSFNLPVRCVRGNKSFEERSMSEISISETKSLYIDNKNSLLWVGAPGGKKWAEALDYCENLTFAGLSDWRLTNINESSLFMENLSNRDPAYSYYYSSTTEEYDPTRSVQDKLKIRGDYMLCVRDNPCETGELWDGTKCMKNPCADLPCKDIEHSDKKICTPVSEDVYSCSCNYYYYWNFNSLKCIESCKSQPCEGKSYSTKECFDDDFKGYSCGCVEGYSWDSASKRCVKDETPDSDNSESGE